MNKIWDRAPINSLINSRYIIFYDNLDINEVKKIIINRKQVPKTLYQLDSEYNIVGIYDGVRDAGRKIKNGKNNGSLIGQATILSGVRKSAYGYYWVYKHVYDELTEEELKNRFLKKHNVIDKDKKKLILNEFYSIEGSIQEKYDFLSEKYDISNTSVYNIVKKNKNK